jgi:phosphate transport system permease protein
MDVGEHGEKTGTENMKGLSNINPIIFAKRKRANKIGLVLSTLAMTLGMAFLLWILSILFIKGFSSINLDIFLNSTPAPGSEGGGLANAIIGSLMIVASCTL